MTLLDYLKSLPAAERENFAVRCGTSVEYLFQVAYGNRKPKAALAIAIERESARAVSCGTLLPDLDWDYLRASAKSAKKAA